MPPTRVLTLAWGDPFPAPNPIVTHRVPPQGKQVSPFLPTASCPGGHCHLDWGQELTPSLLALSTPLLIPGRRGVYPFPHHATQTHWGTLVPPAGQGGGWDVNPFLDTSHSFNRAPYALQSGGG